MVIDCILTMHIEICQGEEYLYTLYCNYTCMLSVFQWLVLISASLFTLCLQASQLSPPFPDKVPLLERFWVLDLNYRIISSVVS